MGLGRARHQGAARRRATASSARRSPPCGGSPRSDARLAELRRAAIGRAGRVHRRARHRGAGRRRAAPVGPRSADGAWFIDGVTRMDDQQHATSALLRHRRPIVEAGRPPATTSRTAWLWALALLATLNPLFVGARRCPPDPSAERATLAAVGGRRRLAARAGRRRRVRHRCSTPSTSARPAGRASPSASSAPSRPSSAWPGAPVAAARPGGLAGRARAGRRAARRRRRRCSCSGCRRAPTSGRCSWPAVLAIGVGATTAAPVRRRSPDGPHRGAWAQRLVTAAALAACVLLVISGVFDV